MVQLVLHDESMNLIVFLFTFENYSQMESRKRMLRKRRCWKQCISIYVSSIHTRNLSGKNRRNGIELWKKKPLEFSRTTIQGRTMEQLKWWMRKTIQMCSNWNWMNRCFMLFMKFNSLKMNYMGMRHFAKASPTQSIVSIPFFSWLFADQLLILTLKCEKKKSLSTKMQHKSSSYAFSSCKYEDIAQTFLVQRLSVDLSAAYLSQSKKHSFWNYWTDFFKQLIFLCRTLSESTVQSAVIPSNIDPNALKSLIG